MIILKNKVFAFLKWLVALDGEGEKGEEKLKNEPKCKHFPHQESNENGRVA